MAGIQAVLDERHTPDGLRALTEPYCLANWRTDHERAFEDFMWQPRKAERLPKLKKGASGIYCVAFGKPSRNMAKKLIPSVKKHMPDVSVCLVSDQPLGAGEACFVERPDRDVGGRIAKIEMYAHAPEGWRYVLYLDADTEIVADVSVLFRFLADGWELVICKNPGKYHSLAMMGRPDNQAETNFTFEALRGRDLLQLNGGVLAFRRCPNVERFFDLWLEEWNRYGGRDQAALHRALWRQPLKTYVLGNEWNTVVHYDDESITAGILHRPQTARRWKGKIKGRLDEESAWKSVVA